LGIIGLCFLLKPIHVYCGSSEILHQTCVLTVDLYF